MLWIPDAQILTRHRGKLATGLIIAIAGGGLLLEALKQYPGPRHNRALAIVCNARGHRAQASVTGPDARCLHTNPRGELLLPSEWNGCDIVVASEDEPNSWLVFPVPTDVTGALLIVLPPV